MNDRRRQARDIRNAATDLAYRRPHPRHTNNGEEFLYRDSAANVPTYLASFTKGLPHYADLPVGDPRRGLVVVKKNGEDPFGLFVLGIQSGDVNDFRRTPLGPPEFAKEVARAQLARDAEETDVDAGSTVIDYTRIWQSAMAKTCTPRRVAPLESEKGARVRAWESAGAGLVFDLQGPDAQATTMPPAPTLDSDELAAEMAEVYIMALLRDIPFSRFRGCAKKDAKGKKVDAWAETLGEYAWFTTLGQNIDVPVGLRLPAQRRRRKVLDAQTLFRGFAPGDNDGPYISQFLLVGNEHLGKFHRIEEGYVQYGAIRIDQRVRVATPNRDYMTTYEQWIDVQNGADLRELETYCPPPNDKKARAVSKKGKGSRPSKEDCTEAFRFITTPRDLATYVHVDALYQAYLNACLLMLSLGIPFDRGIPFQVADNIDRQQGFAHFGGPHILSLVTEVATRALKAVRYQKFNVHRRARPEALGGLIHLYMQAADPATCKVPQGHPLAPLEQLIRGVERDHNGEKVEDPCHKPPRKAGRRAAGSPLPGEDVGSRSSGAGLFSLRKLTPNGPGNARALGMRLLDAIAAHNAEQNLQDDRKKDPSVKPAGNGKRPNSYLLPMAFPEGSPMHPAYGAGHATVAGACVTILKAYFDHGYPISDKLGGIWEADDKGEKLVNLIDPNKPVLDTNTKLTVEGELNKLAANIAIGRDWAGVHYYTDYIESLRLGEEIALGILEEQKLTYGENFTMTVPLYDGGTVRV
ncbi:MAG: bromoperoxidase [Bacteroidota bacterium]